MNTIRWKQTGLVMALFGAASLTLAENPDGRGSGKKGSGGGRPGREKMLERFDTDGDGQLSEAEREAAREEFRRRRGPGGERPGREEMLDKYDKDGDGQLSEKERRKMRKDLQKQKKQRA